ncbi:hypothetical protein [Lichenifustis flavocetrariae]|nr:hypothetical protein [Lichenifustis flavocetrariae]
MAVLLLTMLFHGGALADGRFRNMMPYGEAREMFLRMGYRPYMMPGADICDPDDPRCFPELEYCAKSRTWACTYTWRRGKTIIEVETRYDNPIVARSECVVNCTQSPKSVPASGEGVAAR